MARANGIIKIEGTVEDLTFYKKDGKSFVRRKGGVSKERIESDPNYVRTRENNSEFGHSGNSSRVLRLALGSMAFKAKDSKLHSRLLQVMARIKNLDATSSRGQRQVSIGIGTPEGKLLLKGFDFNFHAPLQSVLHAPFELNPTNGRVTLTDLVPAEQVQFPEGATHVSLQSAVVQLDFATEVSELVYSGVENLQLSLTPTTLTLAPSSMPAGRGTTLFVLMLAFFQEVNGVQYSLKNESYNVLNVIEVV